MSDAHEKALSLLIVDRAAFEKRVAELIKRNKRILDRLAG